MSAYDFKVQLLRRLDQAEADVTNSLCRNWDLSSEHMRIHQGQITGFAQVRGLIDEAYKAAAGISE